MIAKDTLTFLKELAGNNDRAWFEVNRARYEAARQNVLSFTADVILGISEFDKTVSPDLAPKDCVMRIYRDVRFSKNKAPYKSNFGIAISGTGKNFNGPGYYLQIEPGKAFIAGGSWMPSPDHLKQIRQEIDYNGDQLSAIVADPAFARTFSKLSEEDKLKTVPKGYPPDHPMIEFLKLKSFTADSRVSDSLLSTTTSARKIVDMFETLNPFIGFLRNAIA